MYLKDEKSYSHGNDEPIFDLALELLEPPCIILVVWEEWDVRRC